MQHIYYIESAKAENFPNLIMSESFLKTISLILMCEECIKERKETKNKTEFCVKFILDELFCGK